MSDVSAMAELVRTRSRTESWNVWTVVAVNGDSTVDISRLGVIDDHVTCLNGFVPAVNALVLVLSSTEIGSVVLGYLPRRSVSSDA